MLPHLNDPAYLLKEIRIQAQQGRDLNGAALYFNCSPEELDAWCLANAPGKQGYTLYAGHIRSKYESDLLFRQQKMATDGSPVAQRGLLQHLKQSGRREGSQGSGLSLGQLLGAEDAPVPSPAVYVGPHLIEAFEIYTATIKTGYDYNRCAPEYVLILNPGAGERTPYANFQVAFTTRAERDAAHARLNEARLANQKEPLELHGA